MDNKISGEDLGLVKEKRRVCGRGAASGGGRTRGTAGEDRSEEALAVDINDLDRDPRQAIFDQNTFLLSDDDDVMVRRGGFVRVLAF